VTKKDVARHGTEKRDARPDENRDTGDHHPVDASGRKKSLDRDAAVDVSVLETASGELVYDFGGLA